MTDLHALFSSVFNGNSSRFLNVSAPEMSYLGKINHSYNFLLYYIQLI